MGGGVFTRPGATATRARKGVYGNFVSTPRAASGELDFSLQQYAVWPVQRPPFLSVDVPSAQNGGDTMR